MSGRSIFSGCSPRNQFDGLLLDPWCSAHKSAWPNPVSGGLPLYPLPGWQNFHFRPVNSKSKSSPMVVATFFDCTQASSPNGGAPSHQPCIRKKKIYVI
ncbi:hypothetical protein SLA2020_487200 [Shorea laevis]